MLAGKNILVGITGGIAVYKTVDLVSRLVKEMANVKVIMTPNATEFVSPLTFRAITGQTVSIKLFNPEAPIEHISLADWCDIAVIAPATANIIGKITAGIADDLLSTTIMATTAPVIIVPAMNVNMYQNPIFQANLRKLDNYNYFVIPPDTGRLACGYEGKGRFPEPEEILWFIKSYLHYRQDLKGRKILITAGACRENIDPMRYISNRSSGKMGLALARAAWHRGAEVTLIHSEMQDKVPYFIENHVYTPTSEQMLKETLKHSPEADVVIMSAAVTDFKPVSEFNNKIKKENFANLEITKTTDILEAVYKVKKENQTIVGFAAETEQIKENALKKLKKCDYIIANDLSVVGKDETAVTIFSKAGTENKDTQAQSGNTEVFIKGSKFEAAHQILDTVIK